MKKFLLIIIISLFFIFPSVVKATVLINEFSSYDSNDWIELYSAEDTDVSGWFFRDTTSDITPVIPSGTIVGPNKFYVFDAGNRLNKDSDKIFLIKPDQTISDEIDYGGDGQVCAPGSGETVGRFENGNAIERFSTPTKGATNTGATIDPCPTPAPSTPAPTQSPTPAPTQTPTPTTSPTKSPTPKPTVRETPWPTPTPDPDLIGDQTGATPADVLGIRDTLVGTEPPSGAPAVSSGNMSFPLIAGAFIFSGVGLIGFAGFMAYKKQKQNSSGTISE